MNIEINNSLHSYFRREYIIISESLQFPEEPIIIILKATKGYAGLIVLSTFTAKRTTAVREQNADTTSS